MRYRAQKNNYASNLAVSVWHWLWKIGQVYQNQISSSSCPKVVSMQIWLKYANQFMLVKSGYTLAISPGCLAENLNSDTSSALSGLIKG